MLSESVFWRFRAKISKRCSALKKNKRNKHKAPVLKEKKKRRIPKKKLFILLGSLALIFSVYQIAVYFYAEWIIHVYCISAGTLAAAYIIINRGLLSLPEEKQLPEAWSDDKKTEFLEEQKKRRKISSVLLYILVPIILTVIYDMIYLFLTINLGLKI